MEMGPAWMGQGVGTTEQRSYCLFRLTKLRNPVPFTFTLIVPPVTCLPIYEERRYCNNNIKMKYSIYLGWGSQAPYCKLCGE